ncbi:MAG: hypothetical protein BGO58_04330 [Sphingopyxis sp. 65-8]|jgi:prophage tail gpP-like protein|nr:hypothetical protein [Sphingopyxis terrae]OJW26459.1 MAG: hypothetical protein BGO58_04330 [Sphingopyxis sp. 65-8]
MRNYSKLAAAAVLSLAMVSGSAFAADATPTKAATSKPVKKATHHAHKMKKADKKAATKG